MGGKHSIVPPCSHQLCQTTLKKIMISALLPYRLPEEWKGDFVSAETRGKGELSKKLRWRDRIKRIFKVLSKGLLKFLVKRPDRVLVLIKNPFESFVLLSVIAYLFAKLFTFLRKKAFESFAIFCFIVLFVLFLGVGLSNNPKNILDFLGLDETIDSPKSEALRFIGVGMGGVLLVLQAFASYKRAKAMEDTAKEQAGATEHQAEAIGVTEQGQRQERLKTAIDHLANESVSVRLGGAYELFHLADETKELRNTVLDILCAHIRWTTKDPEYQKNYESKPSEEVQSMLTLLFVKGGPIFKDSQIDLQGIFLKGANLFRAQLQEADLREAQLQGAQSQPSTVARD